MPNTIKQKLVVAEAEKKTKVDDSIYPNGDVREERENSSTRHDYEYYHDLMGDKDFLVFEEEGQVYVAQKYLEGYDFQAKSGILVSYLKMPKRKAPSCVFYSKEKGLKELKPDSLEDILETQYKDAKSKEVCENVIDQLLSEKHLLEKTEVFKDLISAFERTKKTLNKISLEDNKSGYFVHRIFRNLSYILSPVGQKDKVIEETVKQNGLRKGVSAGYFLIDIGDEYIRPDLKQKTPYGQVGLTAPVYYGLRKMIDTGASINFRAMFLSFMTGVNGEGRPTSLKEYWAKRLEFCSYLTPDFLDLLGRTATPMCDASGSSLSWSPWSKIEFLESLLGLAGENPSSPLPKKITAVVKLMKRLDAETLLSDVFSDDVLGNYHRQIQRLAPLGLKWPQKYEEFSVENIMKFLGTIKGNCHGVNLAKELLPNASFIQRVRILNDLQDQIYDTNEFELEKVALQQMDKQYAPWREKLKKDLGWRGQSYGIFVPESLAELTEEGKTLRNYYIKSYKQSMALGEKGILFLRKLFRPDTSYYTLEVIKWGDNKYEVRQCHGDCGNGPTPEVISILRQWAADTGKVYEDSIEDLVDDGDPSLPPTEK